MPTTRERILGLLHDRGAASAPEIALALGLTRAACRYHLSSLEIDGLVIRAPEPATAARRGRPRDRYRPAGLDAPEALAALCQALLELYPPDDAMLAALAEIIAGPLPGELPPIQRLNHAIERMNGLGGRARWEAAPAGPRILLRRCPFAALVVRCPRLCRLDHLILERLSGLTLRQTACLQGGGQVCSWEAG